MKVKKIFSNINEIKPTKLLREYSRVVAKFSERYTKGGIWVNKYATYEAWVIWFIKEKWWTTRWINVHI